MDHSDELEAMSDALNRLVKIALDTGEAASVQEAERIFAGYRMQVVAGPDVAESAVLQAALLTAVNCAARAFLGGVTVVGASGPLRVTLPPFPDLEAAAVGLGARLAGSIDPLMPTLAIGDVDASKLELLAIRAVCSQWCGGVVPAATALQLREAGAFTTAGVLAGSLGVAEIFQRIRGGAPMACRRAVGLDLWDPRRSWMLGGEAPPADRLPGAAWLVGMGNLGQAYLWTLGLLPYGEQGAELVLQDTDVLAPSNLSTSLLTTRRLLKRRKTREMAAWAESRGFRASIVERVFAADFKVSEREPGVALIGVDNALARQSIEEVGFGRVIEAGLGRGTQDYLGIDLHTFPASKTARATWPETGAADADIAQPAYREMLERTGDRCGTVRLAGRSIGAPFVGATAAALVVAELTRLCLGGPRFEMVSVHLRDLRDITVVPGAALKPFNPGSVAVAA
jgi:hypothetical protein